MHDYLLFPLQELRNHFLVDHGEQEAQPATARGPTAQPSREPAAMDPRQEHLQAAVGQPLPWANAGGQEMGQPTGSRGGQRSHEPSWSVSGAAGSAAAGGGSGEGGRLTHVDSAGKANMVDVSQVSAYSHNTLPWRGVGLVATWDAVVHSTTLCQSVASTAVLCLRAYVTLDCEPA